MFLQKAAISNNRYTPGEILQEGLFEKSYIACRRKEKRIYTDMELRQLPKCLSSHPHYAEWVIRKKTCRKLQRYISAKKKPVSILEIGCGNGWLSHQLSCIPCTHVTGLDINFTEIKQAARVFDTSDTLKFVYGDLRSGILNENRYDIILFAASIQYFDLADMIDLCLYYLKPFGEIHLTDSPFYQPDKVAAARERSIAYYQSTGFPELADHYFHNSLAALDLFDHEVLYDPGLWLNRLTRKRIPFHWIRIKNIN